MFRSNGIVPSFLIGEHFYTPQYSLPARKSAPQSKMNHRYSEKYLKPTLLKSRVYYTPSEFDNRVGIDNGKGSKNHYFPSIVY